MENRKRKNYSQIKNLYSVASMINAYMNDCTEDTACFVTSREYSWVLCHQAFRDAFCNTDPSSGKDIEPALHLAGYLASWGMYRGSTAVLRRSYLIHQNSISVLRDHAILMNCSEQDIFAESFVDNLQGAYVALEETYRKLLYPKEASQTLLTKILLGVYGCIPAYDDNVRRAFKEVGIRQSGNPKELFGSLVGWLEENRDFCREIKEATKESFSDYLFMKMVDMYFFQYGKILLGEDNNKKTKKQVR